MMEEALEQARQKQEQSNSPQMLVDAIEIKLVEAKLLRAEANKNWDEQEKQFSRLLELYSRLVKERQAKIDKLDFPFNGRKHVSEETSRG